MKNIIVLIFSISLILGGCSKQDETSKQPVPIKFPKSLKELALNDVIINKEVFKVVNNVSAESYFFFKNKDEIKNTLVISDSMRIENYLALLYKFQISGMEFYKSNWYVQIDGGYFTVYVSDYNIDDKFKPENVELAKAMNKKCSDWDKKGEDSKWWKLLK